MPIFLKKSFFPLLIVPLFFVSCIKKNKHLVVSTVAGSGVMGSVDGTGANASFSNLMGLAVDAAGNIIVADSHNSMIRKVTPDGVVTTIAGNGTTGTADGKGAAATFFYPTAVTTDKNGNIYVADTHNSLIRKITPDGVVTTFAGNPTPEEKSRTNYRPLFDNPMGIVADNDGNVFISDWIHDRICKITPDGKATTIAGSGEPGSNDGTGTVAAFYLPEGIALDDKGNLYLADTYNNMIRKITKDGVVTTLAGKPGKKNRGGFVNGKGNVALFAHPTGIAVDKKGNIYVGDDGNNVVRKITPDGMVSTFAGSGLRGKTDGDLKTASFFRPMGVAVDTAGNVYVADYQNSLVRKIGRQ